MNDFRNLDKMRLAGKNMPIIGLINHHPNLVCGVDPHPLRFGKRRNFEYFVYLSIPLDI